MMHSGWLNALLDGTKRRDILPSRRAAKVPADRSAARGLVIGVVGGLVLWLAIVVVWLMWLRTISAASP